MSAHLNRQSRMRRVRACVALAALAAPLAPVAHAAIASCTVTARAVAFGTYTPLTTATSTGRVRVTCTIVTGRNAVTIGLSPGASNSLVLRTMTSGANTLGYNLFIDAANTKIWGNTTGTEDSVTITAARTRVRKTIYGTIPASQDPAPGSYTDTITVTVNY